MSNLVEHARRELELIGEDRETINGYLRVIQAFADMGHSGASASITIPVLNELLSFHNLSDLTNDPNEWVLIDEGEHPMWQNNRRSDAFSQDGGHTYYLLGEGASALNPRPLHVSKNVREYEAARRHNKS